MPGRNRVFSCLLVVCCLFISGCYTGYQVIVGKKDAVKLVNTNVDGTPVKVRVDGYSNKDVWLFIDRHDSYWLFFGGRGTSSDRLYYRLYKAGPGKEEIDIFNTYGNPNYTIGDMMDNYKRKKQERLASNLNNEDYDISNMIAIPEADSCKGALKCWNSEFNKHEIRLNPVDRYEYNLEYMHSPVKSSKNDARSSIVHGYAKTTDGNKKTLVFIANSDGTASDPTTKLVWRRCELGKVWKNGKCAGDALMLSWDQAVYAATQDTYGVYNDWRLPTKAEFETLVGNGYYSKDVHYGLQLIFKDYESGLLKGEHWTSSNSADLKNPKSIDFDFRAGSSGVLFRTLMRIFAEQPVVLVRGGKKVDTDWTNALSALPRAEKAKTESRQEANTYWENVDKKLQNYLNKIADAYEKAKTSSVGGAPQSAQNQAAISVDTTAGKSEVVTVAGYRLVKKIDNGLPGGKQAVAEIECNNGRKGYVYHDPRESYYTYSAGEALTWGDLKLANGNSLDVVAMKACRN